MRSSELGKRAAFVAVGVVAAGALLTAGPAPQSTGDRPTNLPSHEWVLKAGKDWTRAPWSPSPVRL